MMSVVHEDNLKALQIAVPIEASNVYAALIRRTAAPESRPRFQCSKCHKTFICLSSFFLACRSHTDAWAASNLPALSEMYRPEDFRIKPKRILNQSRSLDIKHECKECRQFFTNNFEYLDHLECHKHPSMRVCGIRKQQFSNGIRARAHARKKHPELHQAFLAERKKLKGERLQKKLLPLVPEPLRSESPERCDTPPDESHQKIVSVKVGKGRPKGGKKASKGLRQAYTETKYRDCIICDHKHMTLKSLKKHSLRHNFYDQQTNCPLCEHSIILDPIEGNTALKKHMWLTHKTKFLDVIKDKTKTAVESLEEPTLKFFYCKVCYFPTHPKPDHLDFHMEIFHGVGIGVKCRFCDEKFT